MDKDHCPFCYSSRLNPLKTAVTNTKRSHLLYCMDCNREFSFEKNRTIQEYILGPDECELTLVYKRNGKKSWSVAQKGDH